MQHKVRGGGGINNVPATAPMIPDLKRANTPNNATASPLNQG
jgi:hypothetical protein